MYPMKFIPIYQEKIWGGTHLQSLFGRTLPHRKIGESWELSSLVKGQSIIKNGCYAGKTLNDLTELEPGKIFGSCYHGTDFPLLIKILDATDKLSIQVHPNDAAARQLEPEGQGKTEAWYVLQAEPGAQIIYGLKPGTTKAELVQAMDEDILAVLQKVSVKTGDMIYVPAGRVHALCGGVVVYEVQQTSDLTYRIYDYDRAGSDGKPRQLDVDKAVAVINFSEQTDMDFKKSVITSPYFSLEKMTVDKELQLQTADQFIILCITGGSGEINSASGKEPVSQGETILIPACLGAFSLIGNIECLKIVAGNLSS